MQIILHLIFFFCCSELLTNLYACHMRVQNCVGFPLWDGSAGDSILLGNVGNFLPIQVVFELFVWHRMRCAECE